MKFAVIGAGNGGQCIAGYLAMLGHSVKIQDNNVRVIESLKCKNYIQLEGKVQGEAALNLITTDVEQVIKDTHIIMVVTTADSHHDVACQIAPFLTKDQIIMLNPGHTGGALEFLHMIKQNGCKETPIIAETQDLLFSCRTIQQGLVNVSGIKKVMDIATLPSEAVDEVVSLFKDIFPQLRARSSVLFTSLNNIGAMIHPVPTLLNAGRIESQQTFDYYGEGITEGVAKVIKQMDDERLALGDAFGIELTSLLKWQYETYGIESNDIYEALTSNKSYIGIKAPNSLYTRFLTEDVPCGLVPLANLGKLVNVDMPITCAFIETANSILHKNYWIEGRTLEKLGCSSLEEFRNSVSYEKIL